MSKSKFKDLIQSDVPVLIDFYATWCGPCKSFAPILQKLKDDLGDEVRIIKIDIDKNQNLSQKLGVRSVPTIMIFRNGERKWEVSGGQTIHLLKSKIKEAYTS